MTLNQLGIGQKATITAIVGEGPLIQRLMALGVLEGSTVSVTRKALGGDPIEIHVMGYSLSLRLEEARRVEVALDNHG
jgi:Fe2+ transport system protein FeoA